MNNNNVITIGTTLKWRGVYDADKTYYQENIITAGGCIFRCQVLQSQGQSPLQITDESGHFEFINTDIWSVLLDMSAYYNRVADIEQYANETMKTATDLNQALATISTFAKIPIELKDEDEMDALIASGDVLPDQLYFVAES